MATRLEDEFDPTRINAPDAAYPAGSLKDETTPGVSDDGTPLASRVGNDWQGFSQSALDKAGIVANGQPDSVSNPQILQSIEQMYNDGDSQLAGGNIWPLSSQDSASDGQTVSDSDYYLRDPSTNSVMQISPIETSGAIADLDLSAGEAEIGGTPVTLHKRVKFETVADAQKVNMPLRTRVTTFFYNTSIRCDWIVVDTGAGDMTDGTLLMDNGNYLSLEVNNNRVNPKQFGTYNDMTTDDTTAYQKCVDFASNANEYEVRPSGDYFLGPITLMRSSIINKKGVRYRPNVLLYAPGEYMFTTTVFSGEGEEFVRGIFEFDDNTIDIGAIHARDFGWNFNRVVINDANKAFLSTNFSNQLTGCRINRCDTAVDFAGDGGSSAHDNALNFCSVVQCDKTVIVRSGTNVRITNNVLQEGGAGQRLINVLADVGPVIAIVIDSNYTEQVDDPSFYVYFASNVSGKTVTNNSFVGRIGHIATAIVDFAPTPITISGNLGAQLGIFYTSQHFAGGTIANNIATQNVGTFASGSGLSTYEYIQNVGFRTYERSNGTILANTNTIVINHNLATAPTTVDIQLLTASNIPGLYVTSITATDFTVGYAGTAITSDVIFQWEARYGQ